MEGAHPNPNPYPNPNPHPNPNPNPNPNHGQAYYNGVAARGVELPNIHTIMKRHTSWD